MGGLNVWRHPRPAAVEGRCIGRTEVRVDRRKSKRLAHRIRRWARHHGLPHVVITSPLRRGCEVGCWLSRWGWRHVVDARLTELDFGAWDGQHWRDISRTEIDAWCAAFEHHAPGSGETVAQLLARCAAFIESTNEACVVGHAGWISAACWLAASAAARPESATWPAAIGYGQRIEFTAARQLEAGSLHASPAVR